MNENSTSLWLVVSAMTTNTHVCKQKRKKQYLRIILKYSVTWLLDTFTLHFMEYKTLTAQDEQEYTPQSLVFSAEKCWAGT